MQREAQPDQATLTAFGAVVLVGGGNFVAVRFSNQELAPFWGASLRFLTAAVLLFGIARLRRLPLPRGRALTGALLYGVLAFTAAYALAYYALQRLPAGIASVIMASVPLLTLLFAAAQGIERFRWQGLAGALAAVAGIAVIALGPVSGLPLVSLLAMVGAAAAAAQSGIVLKRFPGSHPVTTNAVAMVTGAILLLALSATTGERMGLPDRAATWTALVYLIVLGSVAMFMLYVFALTRWTASGMSYQFVLVPLVTVALSAWLLDERFTPGFALGGALVLAGTYVGALAPPLRRPAEVAPAPPVASAPPAAGVVAERREELSEAIAAASVCAKC